MYGSSFGDWLCFISVTHLQGVVCKLVIKKKKNLLTWWSCSDETRSTSSPWAKDENEIACYCYCVRISCMVGCVSLSLSLTLLTDQWMRIKFIARLLQIHIIILIFTLHIQLLIVPCTYYLHHLWASSIVRDAWGAQNYLFIFSQLLSNKNYKRI